MRLLIAILLAAALTGCPWSRIVRADPVPAQCDAMCYVEDSPELACESKAKWEGSPADPAAIDALIYGTVPALRKETWACGVRLKACQQCIDRLVKAGVVMKP